MNLKELLGESFKEDMTFADIETALAGMKLADLSKGQYVDKNKYETDVNKLKGDLSQRDSELRDRMTEEQKKQADEEAKDNLIAQLQETIKKQNIENNKQTTIATISESKTLLEIKDDNKEYTAFLDSISTADTENANTIATYFNSIVKQAYEKGKNDSVKNNLGKMGKQKTDGEGKQAKTDGDFGKELAKSVIQPKDSFSYFGKYNK